VYFTVCVLYLNKNVKEKKEKADSTSSLENRKVTIKSSNKRESNICHTEPLKFIFKIGWVGEEFGRVWGKKGLSEFQRRRYSVTSHDTLLIS